MARRPDDAAWRDYLRGAGPPPGQQQPPAKPDPAPPARPGDADSGKGRDTPLGLSADEQREELAAWLREGRHQPREVPLRVP